MCHKGHLDLFKQMGNAAKDMLIGISTSKANLSLRDRTQVISHLLAKEPEFTTNYSLVPKRQPFELMAEIKLHDPNDVVLYLGQDQWELAKAFERHAGIFSVLIPRITSSSVVRGIIDGEDWNLLSQHVPMSILNKVVQLRETELCLVSH